MKSTYNIPEKYQALLDRLDQFADKPNPTDEEILALNAELTIAPDDFQAQADAYCAAIADRRARAAFLRTEAQRLIELAKDEEGFASYLQHHVTKAMLNQAMTKANIPHYELSFVAGKRVLQIR